jgi:L-rhamnose mutarotase
MKRRVMLLLLMTIAAGCQTAPPQRYGMVIGLKEDQVDAYREIHADPWPGVLAALDRSHLRNFSIWLVEMRPHEHVLFACFEYDGKDFDADMAAMGDDETTRKWWKLTDPMQKPIPTAGQDEQWVMMKEVFFHDAAHPDAAMMPPPKPIDAGKAE